MKAKTIEELRNKFFEECVSENTGGYKVINYAPHDLFEWIKENIIQPETILSEPKCECEVLYNTNKTSENVDNKQP